MADQPRTFGTELRRMRIAAGLSLTGLGDRLHYSKGHLSKIENGQKAPSAELVRRCDAELGARGALIALVPEEPPAAPPPEPTTDDEVWLMALGPDASWFQAMNRRDALAMGASLTAVTLSTQGVAATARRPEVLETFRTMFDGYRRLGQTASPSVVQPLVIAQTQVIRTLASQAPPGIREEFLTLGARFAEYAGWMAQESGDDASALRWTAQAVAMAEAGNDPDLAVYALVRRALVTLYHRDATRTIELARQAQADARAPGRIRGLAAQREAQGHALAGDHDACMRSLDRARELLDAPADGSSTPALGPTNLPDSVAMVTGWCLYELGRPRQAGEILDREVARLQPEALRSRARYGVRQALAHASAGQVEHACMLTDQLLTITWAVGSATITSDLRRLARELSRRLGTKAVRDLWPALTAALQTPFR